MTPDHEHAMKEFQNLRQLHSQRSEERQKFSMTVLLTGTGLLFAMVAAAEQRSTDGHQGNLHFHWLIPLLVVALWSYDTRFRPFSARAEELMQRLYDKQIQWLIGPVAELHADLKAFRDMHVQYYSQRNAYFWSTRCVQTITGLPLCAIYVWSLGRIADRQTPLPWGAPLGSDTIDRAGWIVGMTLLTFIALGLRLWRYHRFRAACKTLDGMQPPPHT